MKKIFTLFTFLLLASSQLFSQDVKYTIIYDDPYYLSPFLVTVDPFYADTWRSDISLGYGFKVDYRMKKLLTLNFDYRHGYMDNGKPSFDNSLVQPANGVKHHTFIEATGEFHVSDQAKSTYLRITLSSYSSGGYTYSKFIMVPGTRRSVFSLRGGIYNATSTVEFEDAVGKDGGSIKFYATHDTSKMVFGAYGENQAGSSLYNGKTVMSTQVIIAGVSFKSLTNLKVNTDYSKRGVRTNSKYNDFYFDFLIGARVHFSDIKSGDGTIWEMHNDEIKRIGWRLGWYFTMRGIACRMEWASRPGFKGKKGILSPNSSLMITMGFPFRIGNRQDPVQKSSN